jgi:hypothetical protein
MVEKRHYLMLFHDIEWQPASLCSIDSFDGSVEAVAGGGGGYAGGGNSGDTGAGGAGSSPNLDTVIGGMGAAAAGALEMLGYGALAGATAISTGAFIAIKEITAGYSPTVDQAASYGAPYVSYQGTQ